MSNQFSFGDLDVKLVSQMNESSGNTDPDMPFRVALLGDWSGEPSRENVETELRTLKPVLIDRDNFDEVMKKLAVRLNLHIGGNQGCDLDIEFSELEDFHPDKIYSRVAIFEKLRELRRKLNNTKTFDEAAAEIREWKSFASPVHASSATSSHSESSLNPQPVAGENLLDQILGTSGGRDLVRQTGSSADQSDWNSFLHELTGPYIEKDDDPQLEEFVASVDAAASGVMRAILHDPRFQALESAWRGLEFLTSNLDTGSDLKLYLLNLSKQELAADLSAPKGLGSTGVFEILVEAAVGTRGGKPWAVLCGNYVFDATTEDVEILGRMAKIARQAGAPFIAAAGLGVVGCDSIADIAEGDVKAGDKEFERAWDALRHLPEASYLGLAAPRILLRLPYGEMTDTTEEFSFEEMGEQVEHDKYLWGNPAFACTYLLSESFSEEGWEFRPGIMQDISGLPLHVYEEDGDSQTKPCAEVLITTRTAEAILDRGVMPLLSYKDGDTVRVARFQSVKDPATALAGRWSG